VAESARSLNQVLALVNQLYAAPGTQDGWGVFLDGLCGAVNGSCAHFIAVDRRGQAGLAMTVRSDPAARVAYDQHWAAFDPWGHSQRLQRAPAGAVLLGDEMLPHAALRQTPFYNDFGRPNDLVWCMAGTIDTAPASVSVVSIGRSEHHHPFDTEERAFLNVLMPHLRRALQLHRRIAATEAISADLAETLDGSARAVFLVQETGKVAWMNRAAERLTAARDGLVIDEGELCASRACETNHLRRLLADAARTSTGSGLGAGGALLLGRSELRRPLVALVAPVTRRSAFFANDDQPAAVVIVSDPDSPAVPDVHTLRDLLGLTPAEASVVRLLAEGLTLAEAADRLGLRLATVRTRVKTIFEKTNTHRQADLVRLALSATPQV
jgi:DNA-binding CsgD family transcriptional regulator/PAS domain-containing protein